MMPAMDKQVAAINNLNGYMIAWNKLYRSGGLGKIIAARGVVLNFSNDNTSF